MSRPFIPIPSEELLEVITRKKALGLHANVSAVANSLKVSRTRVRNHLKFQKLELHNVGLEKSVGLGFKTPTIYRQYEMTVRRIREKGELPCLATLVQLTGLTRDHIVRYLKKHPGLAQRLQLVEDDVARVWHEGKVMIAGGLTVTRLDLVFRADVGYNRLCRILKRNPCFIVELQIVRGKMGTNVVKKIYHRKKR